MGKRWSLNILFLLIFAAFIAACSQEPEVVEVTRVVTETVTEGGETIEVTRVVTEVVTETVTEVVTETVTEIVEVPVMSEEEANRTGPWIDTVVVVEEPNADAGVSRLLAEDIDVYANPISEPPIVARINDSDLNTALSYGSYNEITFNPAACADGRLNPFNTPRIREAMNYLVDRDFLIAELLGGLGVPKYANINFASADTARLAPELRAVALQYAYNPELANEIITEEMEALGATLEGGVWTFNGAPVELTGLIRVEDERLEIGDYVANQLEDIGFTVIRDYKTSAEASPIWLRSEQNECLYNYYTGGWVSTAISRDEATNFQFFYTPAGLPFPLFQAYTPTPEFADLAQRLNDNDFTTLEERTDLFREIIPLQMQDSSRIWLYDSVSVAPWASDLEVAADLSGSVYGTRLWPYTLRYTDTVGGSVTWAMLSILTQPWNPVSGSNWVYDQSLIRATNGAGVVSDPYTGLALPQRIERAEVFVEEGLPVGQTLDWVTLEFVASNEVPDDAWVDWDAENQVWLTAAEVYTETQTAKLKSVVYYPDDMFDTITWHDGSPMSPADFVMGMILTFDLAKEASPYYDEAQVAGLQSFLSTFKGMRVVSTDPLVIEHYTDQFGLDAENSVATWWPDPFGFGESAWHAMAPALIAEEQGLMSLSPDKATTLEVEHTNYISGPTLEILGEQLAAAAEAGFIPYEATLGQFITADEAAARYENYQTFAANRGHYWIGTGGLFLQRAFPVEGTAILQRYPSFPDLASKWAGFGAPPLPVAEVDGPGRVTIGDEAIYDVFVDLGDQPYPAEDIVTVGYLIVDATGAVAAQGTAELVEEGLYQITLSSDLTGGLEEGSNSLEIVVVSKRVAIPATAAFEFVTAP